MKIEPYHLGGHTHEINVELFDNVADCLYPSLLQEKVDKLFEIRSFYLLGKFYSSAIFSQNDEKTKIDFRNYNLEKPNRVVPYKMPKSIEVKLEKLMNYLNLSSGSLDLIVNTAKEFIFLEVNPVGQFEQVSYPCNYNIEKIIADTL